ncbi:CDP-diacylglycerol--glycerol-3-phosphate 3-phosphatidyltransferase [Jiangella alkaliphila]|uniref:CDP-diacylglycerol--glycerol-3-phosphate 3-phosphatidyltransferase n=1 Tax=Jiangella alkaliphila TaxID=419479 RepID=A0A1H2L562_9ACTN|nr:CDP-diacylglycerol--glycerol-3-phosphate 3-phosphatidyltransferase [Jiangella alkaliphila]SDU76143.1 CDP-diacylglycerol--glycerol-3-phosphate 3-phosphatidyltransferase [Jiangella alkaliphila]
MAEPSTLPPSPWNIANALTVLRVVLVPVFGWLLLREGGDDDGSRIAAFVAFGVAMLTDQIDGELARRHGLVTDFGKIADPIADKALTGMAFVGLSILGELPWWVTVIVLVREWGITAMRFAVLRYGVMAANRGGKVKTALQTLALGLYLLPLPGWFDPIEVTVMAVAVIVTVATGVDYVLSAIRLRRSATS